MPASYYYDFSMCVLDCEFSLKQVVDFCCGANDFSCLMKQKLEEMGKNCSYKNYDVIQAKVIFAFSSSVIMMIT